RDLVVDQGKLPLEEAVSCILQIAGALAHANSRKVVHRDVKPSNILLTPAGKAKLVDLGLARFREEEMGGTDLTASGVTLGTFDYISPEQARDPRNVDVRSDLYSLGCTFYYMITARPPYPHGTVLQKLLQHQGEPPPDPREFSPGLDSEASRIIQKMMAKDPSNRYQTPEELIRDLMILSGELGLRPSGPSGMVWVSPESLRPAFWERHLPWIAPAAALLIAVAVLEFSPSSSTTLPPVSADFAEQPLAPVRPAPKESAADAGPETTPEKTVPGPEPANDQVHEPGDGDAGDAGDEEPSESSPSDSPLPQVPPTSPRSSNSSGPSEPAPREAPVPEPREAPVPEPESAFVLLRGLEDAVPFATLEAACREAAGGETIELRFNGLRGVTPIQLDNLQVTIRGGQGFQPVLEFEAAAATGVEPNTHMFTLLGGRLTLEDLSLRLTVPERDDIPSESWSFVRTRGAPVIDMNRCALTIRNEFHHLGAAFFNLDAVRGSDAVEIMRDEDAPAPPPVEIRLSRCAARGAASFVRSDQKDQPVTLDWSEGLLALGPSDRLVSWRGGSMAPHPNSKIRVTLNRVTAHVPGGLCWIGASVDAAHPPPLLEWKCDYCVLLGDNRNPLFEISQTAPLEETQGRLRWTGDHVFYQGFPTPWTVSPASEQPKSWTQEQWRQHWSGADHAAQFDNVSWALDPAKQPVPAHERRWTDYQLDPAAEPNLGAPAGRLPAFPAIAAPPVPSS
ncbi:MAG: protein kinase, partial [Planctomycetales bacterium]